ncbi:MAG: hypothetical protein RIR41_3529 [Pseudomonadota bacterium]
MNIAETLASSIGRGVRRTIATAVIAAAATGAPALAQPAMWAVKDADSTIYLFGTVHLLKPETVWKTPKIEAAIKEAEQLWLELPTTNAEQLAPQMMPLITQYGLAPATPLSSSLTPDEMKTLDEAAKLAGMTGQQLNIFRPWFAALTISTSSMVRAGYDPASGVDSKIEAAFGQRSIKPTGLETPESQIKVFANMERDEEVAYLRETMKEYENAATMLDGMVDQWARGDIAAMEQLFVTEMRDASPDLYAALLPNRNANWVGQIEEMLKGKGTIFIAVGAGHLIGEDSVQAMLKAKGIESVRVQ